MEVLISIAQAMRALGALSKDELEAAKDTLDEIRMLEDKYSSDLEQNKQLDNDIVDLYQKLPPMFEGHYDLLDRAHYHFKVCERLINQDIFG